MRRAVPALIATFIGLVALMSFKSAPATPTKAASAHILKPTTPAATAPPTTQGSTPTTRRPTSATGTTPATAPATTPATTPPTTSNAVRTIDGDPFDNRYGTVQVRVTLQGSQITGVSSLQMPFEHQRSAEISQQAEPLLLQEVLQAQSAQIDTIGGATYTSESYAQSLQSALDKR
jgi:uncharacterized protein with FMN-binding domain